LLSKGLRI